jgi:hypothetical protein
MRTSFSLITAFAIVLATCAVPARADLTAAFEGFEFVSEVGITGWESSYAPDTFAGLPISGSTISTMLPVFGEDRVSFACCGTVPSPGGTIGARYDEGALGFKVDLDQLVLRMATALDPRTGVYHSGHNAWHSQGDLFLSVADTGGVSHFGLLNAWPRDEQGEPIELNGGHFSAAQDFHLTGGPSDNSLEGHLVDLQEDDDVTLAGGRGAYHAGNAPDGLDLRTYVSGGVDLGSADLVHETVVDGDRTWHLQTWTVSLSSLSADPEFDIALHAEPSCANDQIGMGGRVPEPGSLFLMVLGLAAASVRRRG